ncbi:hypothetical protein GGU11DRAFT_144348 [Lentinula aff. detonsa]|nr:hypothetical protein GGU11DRAFT_144348 [Lentinula aff. detonsa]
MTRGHPLSDDLRLMLIHMGTQLPLKDVSKYSGVPLRTLQRLYEEYRRTGSGLHSKSNLETRGAKRMLSYDDVEFIVGQVKHRCDIYGDELRELVRERLRVDVNESTIWRYLQRQGYTMKKQSCFGTK